MPDNITSQRFWDNVNREGDECWIWEGPKHPRGYGQFSSVGTTVYAHRFSWELANGHIPEGFVVRQTCGNRSCVLPDHLECVSRGESMRRAAENGVWDGVNNGNARRTETEVLATKILSGLGVPARLLSRTLRIPERSVYVITRGEYWRHLEPSIEELLEICEAVENTMQPKTGDEEA